MSNRFRLASHQLWEISLVLIAQIICHLGGFKASNSVRKLSFTVICVLEARRFTLRTAPCTPHALLRLHRPNPHVPGFSGGFGIVQLPRMANTALKYTKEPIADYTR